MRASGPLAVLVAVALAGCGSGGSANGPGGTRAQGIASGDYAASRGYCSNSSLQDLAARRHVAVTPAAVAAAWAQGFKSGAAMRRAAHDGCLAGIQARLRAPR
jgi:hypothetical protein